MNNVSILIISNSTDFTTDYVCHELNKFTANYLRINRDNFQEYKIDFNLLDETLTIVIKGNKYKISNDSLKSVYYRAPTFLRETFSKNKTIEEQLYSSQWIAFIRNLSIFENAKWINNPNNTFKAENKITQLVYAKRCGFNIPSTHVLNCLEFCNVQNEHYMVKSLDTAIFKIDDSHEGFVYSNAVNKDELLHSDLSIAPIILQNYLDPKIDIRVTVVENKTYSVKILKDNNGVEGDWRKYKNDISFLPIELPNDINDKCITIVKNLNLIFGGIDLIYHNNNYYFIEVNPTGEWGWLIESSNLLIQRGIAECLIQ